MTRAIVIGGGLAGLLAARRLQEGGADVLVLEASDRPGGAIRAEALGGVDVNAGAEAYSVAGGTVDALLAQIGIAEETAAPRTGLGSRLVSAGGTHASPRGTVLGIPGRILAPEVRAVLGPLGTARALVDRFLPARIGARPGVTVQQLVSRRMGRRVAERLVAPMVGGVHSADPALLEAEAAHPGLLPALAEHGSLAGAVRALRAPQQGAGGRSAGTAVRALMPTMARLPERLAELILSGGGQILTEAPATALRRLPAHRDASEHSDIPEHTWEVTAGGSTHRADHLVLAVPPGSAAELLGESVPDIAALIPDAPASPVRLVALLVEAPELDRFPTGTGALVAPGTPGVRAKALTHASAKWEHVAQAAGGRHVLRLSYGRPGEELPGETGLLDVALRDASAITGVPLTRAELVDHRVITWPEAMRQARSGHREAIGALEARLAAEPALELVGTWRAGTGIAALIRADQQARAPGEPTSDEPVPAAPRLGRSRPRPVASSPPDLPPH